MSALVEHFETKKRKKIRHDDMDVTFPLIEKENTASNKTAEPEPRSIERASVSRQLCVCVCILTPRAKRASDDTLSFT